MARTPVPVPISDTALADQLYATSLDLAVAGLTLDDASRKLLLLAVGRPDLVALALNQAETAAMEASTSLVHRRAFSQLARASLSESRS